MMHQQNYGKAIHGNHAGNTNLVSGQSHMFGNAPNVYVNTPQELARNTNKPSIIPSAYYTSQNQAIIANPQLQAMSMVTNDPMVTHPSGLAMTLPDPDTLLRMAQNRMNSDASHGLKNENLHNKIGSNTTHLDNGEMRKTQNSNNNNNNEGNSNITHESGEGRVGPVAVADIPADDANRNVSQVLKYMEIQTAPKKHPPQSKPTTPVHETHMNHGTSANIIASSGSNSNSGSVSSSNSTPVTATPVNVSSYDPNKMLALQKKYQDMLIQCEHRIAQYKQYMKSPTGQHSIPEIQAALNDSITQYQTLTSQLQQLASSNNMFLHINNPVIPSPYSSPARPHPHAHPPQSPHPYYALHNNSGLNTTPNHIVESMKQRLSNTGHLTHGTAQLLQKHIGMTTPTALGQHFTSPHAAYSQPHAQLPQLPQWAQCCKCKKWRITYVPKTLVRDGWTAPSSWECRYAINNKVGNYCEAPMERPDASQYTKEEIQALKDQHARETQKVEERKKKQEQEMNDQTFDAMVHLMEETARRKQEQRFELLKRQQEAIRAKNEKKAQFKKRIKKGKYNDDSDNEEYIPDSSGNDEDDDDDEDEHGNNRTRGHRLQNYRYRGGDEDSDDCDADMAEISRARMQERASAPAQFSWKQFCDERWNYEELNALITYMSEYGENDWSHLHKSAVLMQRHKDAQDCQSQAQRIFGFLEQWNSSKAHHTGKHGTNGATGKHGKDTSEYNEKETEEAEENEEKEKKEELRPVRSSARLRGKEQRISYNEDTALDQYLDWEEKTAKKVQLERQNELDQFTEKIEKILDERTVYVSKEHADEIYETWLDAEKGDRSRDELNEMKQYFVKMEDMSYIHCEWMNIIEMNERFGADKVSRKIKTFERNYETIKQMQEMLYGGEPFNPEYRLVDRIIADIDEEVKNDKQVTIAVRKKYFVKWKNLSYSQCTYETREDIDNDEKIEQYLKWNSNSNDNSNNKVKNVDERSLQRAAIEPGWYDPDNPIEYKNKNKLRDYQIIGVNWMILKFLRGENFILADEMGLGKTVQSACFLLHLKQECNINGPYLIVAPLSTIPNWKRELEEWSDFNVVVYHDSEKSQESRAIIREHEWWNNTTGKVKFDVLLTTYEIVLSDAEYLADISWFLCIVDEGHRLKSRKTKLAEAFKYIKPDRRVLLTGTPIQNNMQELFNLLSFLEPSKFLSFEDFVAKFGEHVDDTTKLMKLREEIQPFVLRRLKETVEKSIPKKEETIIDIELTTLQKAYYKAIYDKNREFLEEGIVSKTSLPNLINLQVQLRKCCNHPWLISGAMERELPEHLPEHLIIEKTIKASGKLVLLDKLLYKLKEEGHKVLIFSQMRRMIEILSDYMRYKQYVFERFDGTTKSLDRQAAIDRFCAKNSNVFAFLLTTRAGGQGLNLVAADTVIIFDSDWNPQQDIQAQARCHRIGQVKEVKVFRFVTKNTYEAQMFEIASRKLGLGHAILKSVEHGTCAKDFKDLSVLDNMLRHGAYALLEEDDSAAKKFEESNIDEILQHSSRKMEMKSVKKKDLEQEQEEAEHPNGTKETSLEQTQIGVGLGIHAFTRSSFIADSNDSKLNFNDVDFWKKVFKIRRNKSMDEDFDESLLDDGMKSRRLLDDITSDFPFDKPKKVEKWWAKCKKHMEKIVQMYEKGINVNSLEVHKQLVNEIITLASQDVFNAKRLKKAKEWQKILKKRLRKSMKQSLNEEKLDLLNSYVNAQIKTNKRRKKVSKKDKNANSTNGNTESKSSPRKSEDAFAPTDWPPWVNQWADQCTQCGLGGHLLLCDGPCVGSYHEQCLGNQALNTDANPWYCDQCNTLKQTRQNIARATRGKSKRFMPREQYRTYVWLDSGDNCHPTDVALIEGNPLIATHVFQPESTSQDETNRDDENDNNDNNTDQPMQEQEQVSRGNSKVKKTKKKSNKKAKKRSRKEMEQED